MRNPYFRGHCGGRKLPQGTLRCLQVGGESMWPLPPLMPGGGGVSLYLDLEASVAKLGGICLPPQCLLRHKISMTPCPDLRV